MNESFPTPELERPIERPEFAEEILKMVEEDQAMRRATVTDPEKWDPEIDVRNTARLKDVIARIGWPTKSKVGVEASHMAWLLVQHADKDPEFQKQALDLMRQAEEGGVEKSDIAYLTDRIQTKEKGTQSYGTQFRYGEDGSFGPYPIEDEEHIEERRAAMGMQTFAEYREWMMRKYAEAQETRKKEAP